MDTDREDSRRRPGAQWLPALDGGGGERIASEACVALVEAATAAAWLCHAPVAVCVVPHHGHVRFFAPPSVESREASRCGVLALVSAVEGRTVACPDASRDPELRGSPHVSQPSAAGLFVSVPLVGSDGAPFGALAVLAHHASTDLDVRLAALHGIADDLSSRIAAMVAPGPCQPCGRASGEQERAGAGDDG
jgi:hypothetical protein